MARFGIIFWGRTNKIFNWVMEWQEWLLRLLAWLGEDNFALTETNTEECIGFSRKSRLKFSLGHIDLRYLLNSQDDVRLVVKYMSLKMKDQLELWIWESAAHIWYRGHPGMEKSRSQALGHLILRNHVSQQSTGRDQSGPKKAVWLSTKPKSQRESMDVVIWQSLRRMILLEWCVTFLLLW